MGLWYVEYKKKQVKGGKKKSPKGKWLVYDITPNCENKQLHV